MRHVKIASVMVLILALAGCDLRFNAKPGPPPTPPRAGPFVRGQMTEEFRWNHKQISIVIRNVQVSTRSRTMGDERVELEFDQNTVVLTPHEIVVNGQQQSFDDYSSVDVVVDPGGLHVSIDGRPFGDQPRNFDLEFVYVAPDGSETSMVLNNPEVAELTMTVEANPPMTCQIRHASSSTVDQYRFAYTIGNTTRERLVVYSGQPLAINKTTPDEYEGKFILRPIAGKPSD